MNHRSATAGDFRSMSTPENTSESTPESTAEKVRVLLIEDDEIDVIAFQRAVAAQALPYRAQVARSLAAARAVLAQESFDVILADNNLPDGSAMELLGTVGGTPVILITGFGDETTAVRALRAGASDYLVKDAERHYLSSLRHRVERACVQSRAERERIKSDARYRSVVEEMSDLVQSVAPDGRIVFVNRAWRETLGYSKAEVAGLTLSDVIDPHNQSHCVEILGRLMAGEDVGMIEVVLRARDGRAVPVEGRLNLHYDSGKPVASNGIFRDLTQRKAAQSALRQASERLSLALSGSRLALWDLDLTTGTVFLGEEWAQIVETESRGPISVNYEELVAAVHPDDMAALKTALVESLKGVRKAYSVEHRIKTARGRWKWVLSHGMVAQRDASGRALRMTGTNADIDERKRADENLRSALLRQEAILRTSPVAVFVVRDRVILQCNPMMERMFGYQPGEMSALPTQRVCAVEQQWRLIGEQGYPAMLDGEYRQEVEYMRKDGSRFWGLLNGTCIDPSQVVKDYLFAIADITDQKATEAALGKAREAADAANQAKSAFLATMSHEIRTPMNAILGLLELVGLTRLDTEQEKMVGVIRDAADSLLRIINDILDVSKIEAGQMQIQPEPASLAEVIRAVAATLTEDARRKGLALELRLDPAITPLLVFDPLRMKQILFNLVGNAIKFTPEGRVELRAALVRDKGDTQMIRIEVEDSGIGIRVEDQAKLFRPFMQAEADTTRRFGGSGLGLVICQSLTQMMGGTLTLSSEPGRGTTLTLLIELRIAQGTGAKATHNSRWATRSWPRITPEMLAAGPAQGLIRVLVAEDNEVNQTVMQRQLSVLGCVADIAGNGAQALLLWSRERYDLVLCDCQMPEMDGYTFARSVRAAESGDPQRKRTPIVACTASAMAAAAQACYDAGMDEVLSKPASLTALRRVLADWVSGGTSSISVSDADPSGLAHVAAAAATPNDTPVDCERLRQITGGDAGLERELLSLFRSQHAAEAAVLLAAIDAGDVGAAEKAAHRIRSAACAVGAQNLGALCESIELAAQRGELAQLRHARPQLERESRRVTEYLREIAL